MDSPWRPPAYADQLSMIAALLGDIARELHGIREALTVIAGSDA